MGRSLRVAMVYKIENHSPFDVDDVHRLAVGVRRFSSSTLPAVIPQIVLLTDAHASVFDSSIIDEILPLKHGLRGWWSKIELFALAGPVLYLDLDTVIVGDLGPLLAAAVNSYELLMLRGFHGETKPCSGIMAWGEGVNLLPLFNRFMLEFAAGDGAILATYAESVRALKLRLASGLYRGDQDWIARVLIETRRPFGFVQDHASGVYSYKADVNGKALPEDARVVVFHGEPRPSFVDPRPAWLEEAWSTR